MVAQPYPYRVRTPEAERLEIDEITRMGGQGGFVRVVAEMPPSRRESIIASMPSAADLDLIVVDPPAEWIADKGWH